MSTQEILDFIYKNIQEIQKITYKGGGIDYGLFTNFADENLAKTSYRFVDQLKIKEFIKAMGNKGLTTIINLADLQKVELSTKTDRFSFLN